MIKQPDKYLEFL